MEDLSCCDSLDAWPAIHTEKSESCGFALLQQLLLGECNNSKVTCILLRLWRCNANKNGKMIELHPYCLYEKFCMFGVIYMTSKSGHGVVMMVVD
jgi:hypothetical protein